MIMRGRFLWRWALASFFAVVPLLVLLLDPSIECLLVTLVMQMIGCVPDPVNICHAMVVVCCK